MATQPIQPQPEDTVSGFQFTQIGEHGTVKEVMRIERDASGVLYVKISGELRDAAEAFWECVRDVANEHNGVLEVYKEENPT